MLIVWIFQAAKRHLTQKIQNVDDKVEKQIDLSKEIINKVWMMIVYIPSV